MKNPFWDGKVHKAVQFGHPFDPRTVEERKRAVRARRAKDELRALRAEERSTFWDVVRRWFWRG
jgi:hypothetical protein